MRELTLEEIKNHKVNPNITLKIAGRPFRCECGCNVFHHPGKYADEFECNTCGMTFESE